MLVKVAVVAALAAYSWWAVARPPFSASATVAVVGSGLVAMLAGAAQRHPRPATPPAAVRVRDVGGWVALVGLMVVWQMQAYLQHPRDDHPTLSSLTDALLDTRPERAVALLAWIVLARELARR